MRDNDNRSNPSDDERTTLAVFDDGTTNNNDDDDDSTDDDDDSVTANGNTSISLKTKIKGLIISIQKEEYTTSTTKKLLNRSRVLVVSLSRGLFLSDFFERERFC